jgi:hypothetical protein
LVITKPTPTTQKASFADKGELSFLFWHVISPSFSLHSHLIMYFPCFNQALKDFDDFLVWSRSSQAGTFAAPPVSVKSQCHPSSSPH